MKDDRGFSPLQLCLKKQNIYRKLTREKDSQIIIDTTHSLQFSQTLLTLNPHIYQESVSDLFSRSLGDGSQGSTQGSGPQVESHQAPSRACGTPTETHLHWQKQLQLWQAIRIKWIGSKLLIKKKKFRWNIIPSAGNLRGWFRMLENKPADPLRACGECSSSCDLRVWFRAGKPQLRLTETHDYQAAPEPPPLQRPLVLCGVFFVVVVCFS